MARVGALPRLEAALAIEQVGAHPLLLGRGVDRVAMTADRLPRGDVELEEPVVPERTTVAAGLLDGARVAPGLAHHDVVEDLAQVLGEVVGSARDVGNAAALPVPTHEVDLEPEPAKAAATEAPAAQAAAAAAATTTGPTLRRPAVQVGLGRRVGVGEVHVVEVIGVRGGAPEGERDLLAVLDPIAERRVDELLELAAPVLDGVLGEAQHVLGRAGEVDGEAGLVQRVVAVGGDRVGPQARANVQAELRGHVDVGLEPRIGAHQRPAAPAADRQAAAAGPEDAATAAEAPRRGSRLGLGVVAAELLGVPDALELVVATDLDLDVVLVVLAVGDDRAVARCVDRRLRAHQPHLDLLGLELMVHRVGREDLALDLDGAGQRRRVGRRLRAALVVGRQADLEHHEPEEEAQQQDDQQRRDDLAVLAAHRRARVHGRTLLTSLLKASAMVWARPGMVVTSTPASATSIAMRASHSIVLCPLSAWRSIWGRAAARLRADIHRRRCGCAGTWVAGPSRRLGRPWAPSRTPTSHQPASRRRASASAPATAAATSTIPSIRTVAGEAPLPPSDASVTSTISATGPKAPANRAAAVWGAPLSAACHAPMAPAPAALTAQRAVNRTAVSVPRSAQPWPASPMKAVMKNIATMTAAIIETAPAPIPRASQRRSPASPSSGRWPWVPTASRPSAS